MDKFKKNIILLPAFYDGVNNQKGILNVENENGELRCNVKCFNIKPTNEQFLFSIVVNDEVYKTKVLAKELSSLTYIVKSNCKSGDKISCLLLLVKSNSYDILLWGSTETTKAWQTTSIQRIENELKKETYSQLNNNYDYINNKQCSTLNDTEYQKEQQEVEDYIDKVMDLTRNIQDNEKNVTKNDYNKDVDYNNYLTKINDKDENNNEDNQEIKEREKPDYQNENFYERVKNQIEDIFNNSEQDDLLKDIIPNGKFCKVKMEEGYYVFGVIYEDSLPRYICYGIPCKQKGDRPTDLEGNYDWLPLDAENEDGMGYWLSYQDASNGKNIKVEVIS